jgi:uncharacterized damage-inducible protein DinB
VNSALDALALRFRFNERLLKAETEGFTAEDWARRASAQGGNSAHWILGHVTQGRRLIARRLGERLAEEPWERSFGMNSKPDGTPLAPAPELLTAELTAGGERFARLFSAIDEATQRARWGAKSFPDGSESVADALHFLYFHETYHLGQIGLLRRILGKPGFV